jgi:hypothetical protein
VDPGRALSFVPPRRGAEPLAPPESEPDGSPEEPLNSAVLFDAVHPDTERRAAAAAATP